MTKSGPRNTNALLIAKIQKVSHKKHIVKEEKKKVNEQAELSSGSDDTFTFDPKSDKFVEKPESKEVKLFVLIGPPAVGKSTWEKKYFAGIPESSILRINRDILIEKMFLSTGFSNKQLFTPVPADLPSDYVHPEFGRVIEYEFNNKVRRAYEKPYKAANSINEKYYKLIMEAVSGYYDYVLLDGIYATPDDRKRAVDLLSAIPNLEKIAVYFESKGHEEEIIGRSEKRAEKMKTEFPIVKGKYFDRTIDKEQYKGIFEKLTPPTYDEPANFDTIMNVKFGGEGEYEVLEEAKKKRAYKPNFSKEKKQGLHGWFSRNQGKGWINCRTGGPCGRSSADKKGGKYPACRPTKAQCKSAGKGPLRKKKSSKPISWVKKKKKD